MLRSTKLQNDFQQEFKFLKLTQFLHKNITDFTSGSKEHKFLQYIVSRMRLSEEKRTTYQKKKNSIFNSVVQWVQRLVHDVYIMTIHQMEKVGGKKKESTKGGTDLCGLGWFDAIWCQLKSQNSEIPSFRCVVKGYLKQKYA
jgi:hypothetical protein